MFPRTEMLDVIVIDGKARGIVTRNLITGKIESHLADAVVLGTGGYGNVFYLSTNAKGSNCTAIWRAYKRGAALANPCFTQIHPTCIPVSGEYQSKLTLMSESLRNDGRIWVPKKKGDTRPPDQIPEDERDYYLERKYPSFGNLVPRDVASRNAKAVCDEGRGVGEGGLGVYLDFADAIKRLGKHGIRERYGNLFDMYERITGENPYDSSDADLPRDPLHDGRPLGGLQPDDHRPRTVRDRRSEFFRSRRKPPRRQRADAGPCRWLFHPSLHDRRLSARAANWKRSTPSTPQFAMPKRDVNRMTNRLLEIRGKRTVASFHRELGKLMWDDCGMARTEAGLKKALKRVPELREEFWKNVNVLGERRRTQSVARKCRPRGGFSGVRRVDVPGRAAAQRILRRPFPRGISNAGRRSLARR